MDNMIKNAYAEILIGVHYISFFLRNGEFSAFNVRKHAIDSHTIQNLNIPSYIGGLPISSIEDNAFVEIYSLKYLTIPNTVISIGDRAFNGCINLKEAILPGSIKDIGFCFQSCDNLENVIFKDGVETISSGAFRDCENIKKIEFSKSIISIDERAFNESKNIKLIKTHGNEEAINFAKKRNIKYI